jgi:hypothetical protein
MKQVTVYEVDPSLDPKNLDASITLRESREQAALELQTGKHWAILPASFKASIPKKERKRVYSEIGSSFAIVLAQGPDPAAHFMGQLLKALGPRNILWGTDSIWWGSPQWLIDAFKALTIPGADAGAVRVPAPHRADEAADPRAQLGASLWSEAEGGALHPHKQPARGVPG